MMVVPRTLLVSFTSLRYVERCLLFFHLLVNKIYLVIRREQVEWKMMIKSLRNRKLAENRSYVTD